MKNLRVTWKHWLALTVVSILTNATLAGAHTNALNAYLQIDGKGKAHHYTVTVKPDGSFVTPALPPDSYTFKFTSTASDATPLPFACAIEYSIKTARETGTGMATGRSRVNKIEAICVKQKMAGSHSSDATWSPIAIDEPGV